MNINEENWLSITIDLLEELQEINISEDKNLLIERLIRYLNHTN